MKDFGVGQAFQWLVIHLSLVLQCCNVNEQADEFIIIGEAISGTNSMLGVFRVNGEGMCASNDAALCQCRAQPCAHVCVVLG